MAICAAEPAFSTMSPTRTMSLSTVTWARSAGAAIVSSPACANEAAPKSRKAAMMSGRGFIERLPLAEQRGSRLHHLVGGADHFGVHLVGALGGYQVGHFGDDIDVGLLEAALVDGAKTFQGGGAVLRRSRRRRVDEVVIADRLQAGLVDESRQPDLADEGRGRRRLSRQLYRNLALLVDGEARSVLRDRDRRLYRISLCVHDPAGVVHLERAVARVLETAVRHQDLEKAFAGDGEVEI